MNIYQHQCSINVWNNKIGRGNGNWTIRTPLLIIFHENGISWSIKQTLVCHTVKTTTISTQQQHLQKHSRCGSSMGEFLSMVWIHTHTHENTVSCSMNRIRIIQMMLKHPKQPATEQLGWIWKRVCASVCEYRIPHIS